MERAVGVVAAEGRAFSQSPVPFVDTPSVNGTVLPKLDRTAICRGTDAPPVCEVKCRLAGRAVKMGSVVTFKVTATSCGLLIAAVELTEILPL